MPSRRRTVDGGDHRFRHLEDAQRDETAAVADGPGLSPRPSNVVARRRGRRPADARPAPVTMTARTPSSASSAVEGGDRARG